MKISEWTEWDIEIISDTKSEIRFDVQWQWQFALLSNMCYVPRQPDYNREFPSPKIMDQDWDIESFRKLTATITRTFCSLVFQKNSQFGFFLILFPKTFQGWTIIGHWMYFPLFVHHHFWAYFFSIAWCYSKLIKSTISWW